MINHKKKSYSFFSTREHQRVALVCFIYKTKVILSIKPVFPQSHWDARDCISLVAVHCQRTVHFQGRQLFGERERGYTHEWDANATQLTWKDPFHWNIYSDDSIDPWGGVEDRCAFRSWVNRHTQDGYLNNTCGWGPLVKGEASSLAEKCIRGNCRERSIYIYMSIVALEGMPECRCK